MNVNIVQLHITIPYNNIYIYISQVFDTYVKNQMHTKPARTSSLQCDYEDYHPWLPAVLSVHPWYQIATYCDRDQDFPPIMDVSNWQKQTHKVLPVSLGLGNDVDKTMLWWGCLTQLSSVYVLFGGPNHYFINISGHVRPQNREIYGRDFHTRKNGSLFPT